MIVSDRASALALEANGARNDGGLEDSVVVVVGLVRRSVDNDGDGREATEGVRRLNRSPPRPRRRLLRPLLLGDGDDDDDVRPPAPRGGPAPVALQAQAAPDAMRRRLRLHRLEEVSPVRRPASSRRLPPAVVSTVAFPPTASLHTDGNDRRRGESRMSRGLKYS